jgi:hypothetical protein
MSPTRSAARTSAGTLLDRDGDERGGRTRRAPDGGEERAKDNIVIVNVNIFVIVFEILMVI